MQPKKEAMSYGNNLLWKEEMNLIARFTQQFFDDQSDIKDVDRLQAKPESLVQNIITQKPISETEGLSSRIP
jgi:hypothetical protein